MPFSLFKKSSIPQKNEKKIDQEDKRKYELEQLTVRTSGKLAYYNAKMMIIMLLNLYARLNLVYR